MENFIVSIEPNVFTMKKLLEIEAAAAEANGKNIIIRHGTQNQFIFKSKDAKERFEKWLEAYMNE